MAPRVPTLERQVARQPIALPFAPQIQDRSGLEFSRSVDRVTAALEQVGMERDARHAKQADMAAWSQAQEILNNPETGYFALQGEAVLDGREGIIQQLEELYRTPEGMSFGAASRYDPVAQQRLITATSQINTHAIRTEQVLNKETAQARAAQQLEIGATNHSDPGVVKQSLITGMNEMRNFWEGTNQPDAVVEQALAGYASEYHATIVEAKLAENPAAAAQYLEEHAGSIMAKPEAALRGKVERATVDQVGQTYSDAIFDPNNKTDAEMIAEVNKIQNADHRASAKALLKARIVEDRDAKAQAKKQLPEDEWRKARDGSVQNRHQLSKDLEPDDFARIARFLEDPVSPAARPEQYIRLMEQFGRDIESQRLTPDKASRFFEDYNLPAHEHLFLPSHYKELEARQLRVRAARASGKPFEPEGVLSDLAARRVSFKKDFNLTTEEAEPYVAQYDKIKREHETQQGRHLTFKEQEAIYQGILAAGTAITDVDPFFVRDDTKLILDLAGNEEIGDIPATIDSAITAKLNSAGLKATDDRKSRVYLRYLLRVKYGLNKRMSSAQIDALVNDKKRLADPDDAGLSLGPRTREDLGAPHEEGPDNALTIEDLTGKFR